MWNFLRTIFEGPLVPIVGAVVVFIGALISVLGSIAVSQKQNEQKLQFERAMREAAEQDATFQADMRRKTEEALNYATGADSFVYLHFQDKDGSNQASLRHEGKFPVRGVLLNLWDINKTIELVRNGMDPGQAREQTSEPVPIPDVRPDPQIRFRQFFSRLDDRVTNRFLLSITFMNGDLRRFSQKD